MENMFNLGGGIPNIGGPKLDPRDYPARKCKKCGSILFDNAVILKEIPGSAVGQPGEEVSLPLKVFVCKKCGEILDSDIKDFKLEKDLGLDEKDNEPKVENKQSQILLT